ncbi:MAG: M15 family metallopeptidase [Eubacteriales bacterium]
MKKYIIIALIAMIFISGCSKNQEDEITAAPLDTETTESADIENTETPEIQFTPEPTAEPYVFNTSSISWKSLNGLLINQDIPEDTTQIVLVVVDGRYDKMYLMEKAENGMWQVVDGPFDVQLGKNGLGKEKEGDGKSPVGVFELGYAFGKDEAPTGTTWPWRTTEKGDIWVEDSNSKYYNMFMQEDSVDDADWKNYSNLNITPFERAIEIRYNSERKPGVGSAIFLHIWTSSKKDTSGCTAISRENINKLIAWLDPNANTHIVQLNHNLIGGGGLVYLSDFTTDIIADIKFATSDNILGVQLDGYNDNQVITTVDAANALIKANEMLETYGYRLIVNDAYRPVDAFYQIEAWLDDEEDIDTKDAYYAGYTKAELREKYISYDTNRLYIRGSEIDVSLADLSGNPVDMGGEYMVFDEFTSYICDNLTPDQIYNREILHDVMLLAGFKSIDSQWWKFNYNSYLYSAKYDEVIE